jgi:hypothetical protein
MIHKEIMEMVIADTRKLTEGELTQIRAEGLGNGFTVLNPEDGFRRDGTVWFGTCSECGEQVSNSWRDGVWEHTVRTVISYHADGVTPCQTSNQSFGYCPERGEA